MRLSAILLTGALIFGQAHQVEVKGGTAQDRKEVEEFLQKFRQCVADNDRQCVSSMVEYPIGMSSELEAGRKQLIIANPDDLQHHFDEVFNSEVRRTLLNKSDENLTYQWGRIYILGGDRQIWLERVRGAGFRVTAVGVSKYHVAGIENAAAAEAFFADLQKAIKAADKQHVCAMVDYPISVVLNGHPKEVRDANEMIRSFDLVFNDNVRKAIAQQLPSRLRANWRGLIVGAGQVWFTKNADSQEFRITAINP